MAFSIKHILVAIVLLIHIQENISHIVIFHW